MITERIEKCQHEKEEQQAQPAVEIVNQVTLTAPRLEHIPTRTGKKTRTTRISSGESSISSARAVYLHDDRFTLILNGSDPLITIDDILTDEIEEGPESDLCSCDEVHRWLRTPHQPNIPSWHSWGIVCACATQGQHISLLHCTGLSNFSIPPPLTKY